jgi:hypothetical protein
MFTSADSNQLAEGLLRGRKAAGAKTRVVHPILNVSPRGSVRLRDSVLGIKCTQTKSELQ